MVRPYAVKGRKRKKREVEVEEEEEEEEQSAEETHEEEEEEDEKTEIGEVEGERNSNEAPFELPGIPVLPSNQKPKAGVIFVLERASLEVAKVGKTYQILNSDDHSNFLRKHNRNPADYRPDIVHQALLAILDSPLNKAGRLRALYVKTEKGVLFEVKPHVRMPRTFKRFCGVMLQLLQKLSITATSKREKLLRVIKNPVTRHLPVNSRKIGFSFSSEKLVQLRDYVAAASNDVDLVFVVGAMAHGKIDKEYTDDFISVSAYPLSAACCIGRICTDTHHPMAGSGTSDTDDDCYDTESSKGTESDDEGCFLDYGFQPQIAPSCQVITKESLLEAQTQDLCKVMDMLTLREQHARTLLIYHRWDVERLFAVLVDKGRDQLFSEAGVTILEHKNPVSLQFSQLTCNICIEDMSPDEFTSMDCGHCFCNKCWTEHFIVKINEGQSKRIRCMEYTCKAICDEAVVRKLVNEKHPDIAERFDHFLLQSFIEDNSMVKWCPSIPHCGNAIRVEGDPCCEVECACGLQFCFKCSLETHSPCSCIMWDLWSKKCLKESEAMKWIIVNTKPCPKCHKPVEKNGGCNLVTCVCGQPFCWVCGGATGIDHTYSRIIGHTCGRYKEDSINKARVDKEIYRYMHYNTRYQAHTDSFDIERKLKGTIQNKISVYETNDSGSKDYSWITNGLDRLLRCRRILSYSYAFAYYMFGNDLFKDEMTRKEREMKMNLFEDQQQQLEANVERLSKYIGEPFNQSSMDKVWATRMQVINLSVVTDQMCKKMYECIENDLLGPLQTVTHNIAPYKSKCVEKASQSSIR